MYVYLTDDGQPFRDGEVEIRYYQGQMMDSQLGMERLRLDIIRDR